MCDPIVVNPVVKMRPHPAAHPPWPLIRKYPPPPPPPRYGVAVTLTVHQVPQTLIALA